MSQRESGYARKVNDAYQTPTWVTEALVPHLPVGKRIWEPAAGLGSIADALTEAGYEVIRSDLAQGTDFLICRTTIAEGIVTNPPYGLAQEFIEHALKLTEPWGWLAMLLRTDYDHAKSRQHLFGGCPAFAKKLVLTRRIIWFPQPGAAPSFNHAWFLWDHAKRGAPVLAYGP